MAESKFPSAPGNLELPGGLKPGQILDNRYEIVCHVGSGGMGVVYKVMHMHLRKPFALKTLLAPKLSKRTLSRFRQEAKAASALNHQGLIKVYDFGLTENGQPFMVMDFVEGGSLADAIKNSGQLSLDRVLNIFEQASSALAHAHDKGIIHRDLKPSNILLEQRESFPENVKIADFGVAKMLEDESGAGLRLTATGAVLGSPLYMSPEQCSGKKSDQRSDIYSLGCAMFEALTGCPPFQGDSTLSTLLKHQQETPPSLTEGSLGKAFPSEIEDLVSRMLAKDPGERCQSMQEVNSAIADMRGGECSAPRRVQERQAPIVTKTISTPKGVPLYVMICLSLLTIVISSVITVICLRLSPAGTKNDFPGSVQPVPIKQPQTSYFGDLTIPQLDAHKQPQASHFDDAVIPPESVKSVKTEKTSKERILHFPEKYTMGGLSYFPKGSYGMLSLGQAKGTRRVAVDTRLELRPSYQVCQEPRLLDRFLPDDFFYIDFQNVPVLDDHILKYVSKLTGLHGLNLTSTNITDEGVAFITDMSQLDDLCLSSTGVTGEGIALLSKLKYLKALELNYVPVDQKMLSYFRSGPALIMLELKHTGLGDNDLKALANLKHIRSLRIQDNPKITDDGLKYLAPLPKLEGIDLRGCGITVNCTRNLKLIPHLQSIAISRKAFTQAEISKIKHDLPNIVVMVDSGDRQLDFLKYAGL